MPGKYKNNHTVHTTKGKESYPAGQYCHFEVLPMKTPHRNSSEGGIWKKQYQKPYHIMKLYFFPGLFFIIFLILAQLWWFGVLGLFFLLSYNCKKNMLIKK